MKLLVDLGVENCQGAATAWHESAGCELRDAVNRYLCVSGFLESVVETVAAGQHHVLLIGPQPFVTSLVAKQMVHLLPPPTPEESRSIEENYAAAGLAVDSAVRPIRAPDPTVALSRFLHSASAPRLGELGLAAHGVLMLEGLTAFALSVLERIGAALLLEKSSLLERRCGSELGAMPQMVATMTPCPCGYLGHPDIECSCEHAEIAKYHRQIPWTLRSAIDVVVALHFVEPESPDPRPASIESSREGVAAAWRFRTSLRGRVDMFTRLTSEAFACAESFAFVGERDRGATGRLIRVAATIADLSGSLLITDTDIRHAAMMVLPTRTLGND